MAVHGRFGEPCLVCGQKVQRIRYADNEPTIALNARLKARYSPTAAYRGC